MGKSKITIRVKLAQNMKLSAVLLIATGVVAQVDYDATTTVDPAYDDYYGGDYEYTLDEFGRRKRGKKKAEREAAKAAKEAAKQAAREAAAAAAENNYTDDEGGNAYAGPVKPTTTSTTTT